MICQTQKKFQTSLFLFRRDLRLEDNTGLIFALTHSENVIAAFIFTPEQIEENPYRSDHCLKFMIESLEDLESQLKEKGGRLYLFKGDPEKIVSKCISELNVEAVIANTDYTPYSKQRDKKLEDLCKTRNTAFYLFEDVLLHPPEETLKKNGTPYLIFTPYFRNASKLTISSPIHNQATNYFRNPINFDQGSSLLFKISPKNNGKTHLIGGRAKALKILKNLETLIQYDPLRNFPAEDYSTHLSPYLKFTVCSAREVYKAICHHLDAHHDLVRSLYWRDFFTTIAFFFPHVFTSSFHSKFDQLKWSSNEEAYQCWCKGITGIPIVDAGMREMNETGFMHNRVRMIAASFLIKDLHINWRWGEKYFAQTLIDYDPAVNNGNWQWVAGTGCDAQPYFRIFNPWSQQKKFDSECLYIKKWIPELRPLSPDIIHTWHEEKHHLKPFKYPFPIINHEEEAKKSFLSYSALFR